MAVRRRARAALTLAILVIIIGAGAGYYYQDVIKGWLSSSTKAPTILLSGNIEAHQSVLAFNMVQSRIVDLPFDEGQWVRAGTLIARLDDSDYRQQLAISEAALEVQQRQLAATQQNLVSAQKTVDSDVADLYLKKAESARADALVQKGAGTLEARDQADAVEKQSNAVLERDQALEKSAERQIDLVNANIHSAQETVKMNQILLDYTNLRAPFDGVITVRQAELGEIMVPGTPVLTLADLDHVWLRGYINETGYRQDPLWPRRQGHDGYLSRQDLSGPRLLHLLRRRIHPQVRRNACRTRHARLSHQDRHR